jgi:hypothetical protein
MRVEVREVAAGIVEEIDDVVPMTIGLSTLAAIRYPVSDDQT